MHSKLARQCPFYLVFYKMKTGLRYTSILIFSNIHSRFIEYLATELPVVNTLASIDDFSTCLNYLGNALLLTRLKYFLINLC